MKEELLKYWDQIDWKAIFSTAGYVLVVLVLALVTRFLIRLGMRRFEQYLLKREEGSRETTKRIETLTRLLRQVLVVVVWVIAVFTILSELGVDMGPILASAGIVGLAVGFGAQNLVRDVISGFFLLLEDQIRVGDVAIVNGTGGLVEAVRLRTVILRDMSGTVHTFPNGTITTLANMTKDWSAYVFDIGVAYKEDTDRVVAVMKEVGETLRQDEYFGPLTIADLEVFGVNEWADSAVVIKARMKTLPISQWEVGREFLRRLKQAFDREGIEIPFPHQSIYFGEASKPFVAQLLEKRGESGGSP